MEYGVRTLKVLIPDLSSHCARRTAGHNITPPPFRLIGLKEREGRV